MNCVKCLISFSLNFISVLLLLIAIACQTIVFDLFKVNDFKINLITFFY